MNIINIACVYLCFTLTVVSNKFQHSRDHESKVSRLRQPIVRPNTHLPTSERWSLFFAVYVPGVEPRTSCR